MAGNASEERVETKLAKLEGAFELIKETYIKKRYFSSV